MKRLILSVTFFLGLLNFSFAQWTTNGTNINNSNSGNVGIGTTTPGALFVVNGKGRIISNLHIGSDEDGPSFAPLDIKGTGPNIGFNVFNQGVDGKVWSVTANGPLFRIITENDTYTAIREALTITRSGIEIASVTFPNGNVAIGTTNPQGYKLAVNGDAIFTRIKVKAFTSWPDYVFHSSYQLPSLNDLEQYIKANNHLPDVPSADSVEKNGLDVGNNESVLLKKIEEITLYMIELNKKVDELKEENKALKARLENSNH